MKQELSKLIFVNLFNFTVWLFSTEPLLWEWVANSKEGGEGGEWRGGKGGRGGGGAGGERGRGGGGGEES